MGTPSPRDQLSVVSPFANANENRNGNPGMARGGEFSPTPQPPENMQNASKCPTPTLTYVTKMDASKLQVTPPTFLEEGDLVDVKNVGGWDTQKEMKSFSVLDVSDAQRNSVESPAQLAANMTKEDFLPVTENVEREPGQRRFVALQQLPSRSESSSSKNPFLDVTEETVNNSHGDAPNNSAPQQAILASSFVSAAASPFGQSLIGSSAQERGGVSSGCSPGLGAGLLAEERSGSPSSTSGGATLVNPFSKVAGNSILAARSRSGSFSTPSAYIGMSTTPLGAGGSTSASVRAPGSGPSFAIFVGGTALGNAQCIAGCFHHSTALSHQSSVLTPSLQRAPAVTAMSQRNLKDSMSSSFLMKYNRDRATCDPTNTASTLSFITLEEALTNSCTLVDRKGVRGTQLGRAYVKAVREGVFLSATRVASWMADPDWPQIEQAFAALGPSVPAPLVDVLQLIFSDAMDPVGKGFLWKEKGRSCLADLFNTASAAAERSGGGHPSPSSYTPADSDTASLQLKAKEGSAGLRKIEDLLCAGSREEAVETALQHGLYAHALLISMMCPTKDFYIRSVKAIIEKELVPTSPLSHAYAMFNEMPLPPLLSQSQPSPSPEMELGSSQLTSVNASSARLLSAEERNNLRHTWRRHAAVLLANFTRSSGEGLLQLADALQRIGLLMEAHTCVLALHLTPLGMAAAVRASEKRQQPLSVSGGSSASLALPRPEQSFVMKEIRNRLGVVGGAYHPMEGCRTSFLTPVTTALSMLLHAAQVKLDERAPPRPEVDDGPLIAFHGLPQSSPRYSVAYHLMQVLWMRELGLQKEAEEAMSALLNKMPAPVAFSMQAPPRTLNELVFLFGAVRPEREATALPPQGLPGNGPSSAAIPPPGPAPREQSSDSPLPPNRPSSQSSPPMHQLSPDGPPVAAALAKEPAMALQPIKEPPTKQRVSSPEEKLLPPPPPLSESSTTRPPLSSQQRAAALQPPPPSASSGPTHGSDAQAGADTRKSTSKPAPSKRSSSVDALRNFFFRRGRSEDVEGDGKAHKLEEAKPMILNTEKPPQFDSATGRWLFEETEEEKAQQEMVKKGPPKIGPRLTSTTNSGGTVPAVGPPSAPVPLNNGGGAAHPSPTGPRVAANNGGPKGPPGPGGMQRPGKRPQYVDMFNSM